MCSECLIICVFRVSDYLCVQSRSKNEDPEQLKLKQKAKELQQAEAEEVRQREANLTALAAIGPRKKRKLDIGESGVSVS